MAGNKEIFARNLVYYMEKKGIDRNQLCSDLNLKYSTVRDWIKGITYPRIGKVELLANYFEIQKSDLIEDKTNSSIGENKDSATQEIPSSVSKLNTELNTENHAQWVNYGNELLEEQNLVQIINSQENLMQKSPRKSSEGYFHITIS